MADLTGLPPHLHSVLQGSGAELNRPNSAPGFGATSTFDGDVRLNPRLAVQPESFQRAPTPPPGGQRIQEQSFADSQSASNIFGTYGSNDGQQQQQTRIPGSTLDGAATSAGAAPGTFKPDIAAGGNSVFNRIQNDFPRTPSPVSPFGSAGPAPANPPSQPDYNAYYAAIAASQASGAPFNPAAAAAAAAALAMQQQPHQQQQHDPNAQLAAAMYNLNVSQPPQNASANGIGVNAPAYVPPSQPGPGSGSQPDYNNPYMQQQASQQAQQAAAYYQYYQTMQNMQAGGGDPGAPGGGYGGQHQRPPSGPPGAHGAGGRPDG